jgi:hypothetical protein
VSGSAICWTRGIFQVEKQPHPPADVRYSAEGLRRRQSRSRAVKPTVAAMFAHFSDLAPLVWVVPYPDRRRLNVFVGVFLPETALIHSRTADLSLLARDRLLDSDTGGGNQLPRDGLADARQRDISPADHRCQVPASRSRRHWVTLASRSRRCPRRTAFATPMNELETCSKAGCCTTGPIQSYGAAWRTSWSRPTTIGGLKPDKRRSHEKIDAVVGLATALDGAIRQPLHTGLVYDTRGVLFT